MSNNRRNNVPDYLKEPFVPEYQRLNREPEQFIDPRFAANAPVRNFRTAQKRGLNAPVPGVNSPSRKPQGELMRADPQYQNHPPAVSEPMPAHVGNYDDPMWINERVTGAPPARTKVVDGGEYIDEFGRITASADVSGLQGQNPFEHEMHMDGSNESAWIRAYNEANKPKEIPKETQGLNIRLAPGETAVVFNDKVIEVTTSDQNVREVVESIIMKYDVTLDEIAVYKRQPIDFGVIIK